jgi:chemotaxis protein methyltransferase CheR/two-component system CheB/CheR fusion protein
MTKEPSPSAPKSARQSAGRTLPIVGLGASAGGLEALERFFANVPTPSEIAFVVVQHLGPTYKGMLGELLQRVTPMTVVQAGNRMKVKPNYVYVIPPNKDLSILHGVLYLLDTVAPRGLHLPIDFFFRVLAEDQGEYAIGVILSGMGSDGTLGLRTVKEQNGLTLVQDPASAKFDSMPRSAIDAGFADIVAPVEELPRKIIDYLQRFRPDMPMKPSRETRTNGVLEQIVVLLRERTGNDFSLYKRNTLARRAERRMGIHQIGTLAAYVLYLRENPQELDLLFKELLIGVTSFFRDPAVWDYMKLEVLPRLLASYPKGGILRAWVAACSTGEEAYSLAMLFKEAVEELKPRARFALQIFATDLDEDAIDRARQGIYPANIAADVSQERLGRFFTEEQNGYRISREIRQMVIFAPQNVVMDPPFTKLDILTCRNLLIYLGPALQERLLPLFHYALNPGGILLLGSAETVGAFSSIFDPLESKTRLYVRTDHPLRAVTVEFPTKFLPLVPHSQKENKAVSLIENLQHQADQLLLRNFSPAAVLVNSDGDILYISGRTGKYLEPAAGKANWNIYAMAREGLRHELAGAMKKAMRQQGSITLKDVCIVPDLIVNITIQAIEKPTALRGMIMIVFTDQAALAPRKAGRAAAPNGRYAAELEEAHEEIQILREEMQSSHEELTAANEELQSTNEELQSSIEELTTSKEEMQSLNEELQTVNAELQSKVDDLSTVNNDMTNLLNATDIATVFLDNQLNIRRFTTQATEIFKLIPGDVGRPLSDIVTELVYPEFQYDLRQVLQALAFKETQVETNDGRWFKVRIMPYRTADNVIDGVVITFTDITTSKVLEAELREAISVARR